MIEDGVDGVACGGYPMHPTRATWKVNYQVTQLHTGRPKSGQTTSDAAVAYPKSVGKVTQPPQSRSKPPTAVPKDKTLLVGAQRSPQMLRLTRSMTYPLESHVCHPARQSQDLTKPESQTRPIAVPKTKHSTGSPLPRRCQKLFHGD